jgi:outer membrane beta-barrel protein
LDSVLVRAALAVSLVALVAGEAVAETRLADRCIDQEIADRLAIKRRRRGHQELLFVKQQRHEFSLVGGTYVSDLYSSSLLVGGSYSFHMTEQTAIEMSFATTHANAELIRAIEDNRGRTIDEEVARVMFGESLLVWSPVHGKFRLGGSVVHFDIHLDAGVGVVDSQTSRGVTGVGGIGFKVFAGKAVAFRLDVRDHVFQQELLDESFLVNDVSATAGVSLFLPFRN